MSVCRTVTCKQLAALIGGSSSVVNGVKVVQTLRPLNLSILGRRSRSPLTLPFALSVENPDRQGRTLNLGETVILEAEINPFITELRKYEIKISALHNHWIHQGSSFKYIHWESIGCPYSFVKNSAAAAKKVGIL